MCTKRIFRALMITATVIISSIIVDAQRINREALHKLSHRGEAGSIVTGQAPAFQSNHTIERVSPAQEASQAGLLNISAHAKKANAIVGTWLDTVIVTDGPTFKALSTYTEGGLWVFTNQGDIVTESDFPHVFSVGQGVWAYQGGRTFSQTGLQLLSDLKGDLVALSKVRQTLTLNEAGDAYSVVWTIDFIDPAGHLVGTVDGTIESQRIKDEPLP
jgi:hypothetical protein